MTKIIVPATSANLGCGFDSLGLAVNLYLTLEITGSADTWHIDHDLGPEIASDASNLILTTALKIAPSLTPQTLRMTSDIPLEHGLGSSSSAIVAGILLADHLAGLGLTTEEMLRLACDIEGHPDNVAPAILGGLVVGSQDPEHFNYQTLPAPDCALIAVIPPYNVSTHAARAVLPDDFSRPEAVLASSRANVLVAALANKNYAQAGALMEQDLFHESYRATLIPDVTTVRAIAHAHGAYGTYLSGAGSTIMTLAPQDKAPELLSNLTAHYADVRSLSSDLTGAHIKK
ncbi:MAG: homoserine kinase [Streptococcaceae bacterium]|jgi:homoserine kinase|nr:homoserine kinase [Streptococcaceae bacterium]